MKYLKILIVVVVLIIIALTVYIVAIKNIGNSSENDLINNNVTNKLENTMNNNLNSNSNSNNLNGNNLIIDNSLSKNLITTEELKNYGDKMNVTGNVEKVTSTNMFYIVENCIQSYINNITNNNSIAVYNQLSQQYVSTNGINTTNVFNYVEKLTGNQEYRAIKMNYVQGTTCDQYSVYGKLLDNAGSSSYIYLIVNINTGSLTYSIIPQVGRNYTDLSQVKIALTDEKIDKNQNNQATYKIINENEIVLNIIEDYKKNALYDIKSAYESLDDEYSKARFQNYTEYFNYVQNNVNKIQNLTITKYNKIQKAGNVQYNCTDNYGNNYTIYSTGIREYTIALDDYTIETAEYKSNYANLSENDKVKEIINKFIKMLNTCDYTHIYNTLNDNFKSNYFNTQDSFESYAKQNFLEYNVLDELNISESQGVYICTMRLKNKNTVSASTITKTIIVKLKSDTNFEMSFSI